MSDQCLSADNGRYLQISCGLRGSRLKRTAGSGEAVVAESEEFRIRQINLEPGERFEHPAGQQPMIISVVRGSVFDEIGQRKFEYGMNVLVPYVAETRVKAAEPASLLITDRFFMPEG